MGTLVSRGVGQVLGLLWLGLGLVALYCCFFVSRSSVCFVSGQFSGVLIRLLGVFAGVWISMTIVVYDSLSWLSWLAIWIPWLTGTELPARVPDRLQSVSASPGLCGGFAAVLLLFVVLTSRVFSGV